MGEIIHNKLVRDKIPAIITKNGDEPVWHVLKEKERLLALLNKLIEEAKELLESGGSLEERADVAEVLKELDKLLGFDESTVETERLDKANKRGGFSSGVFLDKVITND
jgi:predicted house-cleaning noncanonical NTP pyrophosphatase (MazG superfamily)